MKRAILLIGGVIISALILNSCKKDSSDDPSTTTYLKFGEATSVNSTFSVEMCSCDSLFVGYNNLYFKVINKSSGQLVKQATITLHPIMDMVTFTHACPVENPPETANADGYFNGVVLFSMPGTNSWSVSANITAGGIKDSVFIPLSQVSGTTPARKIVVIDSLETTPGTWKITKYPMSLVMPASWQVGLNKFEFTIHKMASMYSFPAVTDMTVEITPEMPSMGHGSPNNVNPVHVGNGHYSGTVNFTMTGDWRIHLKLTQNGRVITDKAYFDILF
jgi:hypothetical protein